MCCPLCHSGERKPSLFILPDKSHAKICCRESINIVKSYPGITMAEEENYESM